KSKDRSLRQLLQLDRVPPQEQVGCQAAFASRLTPTEKQNQKIAAFGSSYSWIAYHLKNRSAVRPPSRAGSPTKQTQSSAAARGEAAPLNNERKLEYRF
ncbi:hypothetical protein ACPCIT_03005, partial [Pseudomonas siliginis]|uniref:hypothetical protein n=1 Tax=Pseudomonas siliginis TaxID=2842346 RepID=UPI003C30C284